MWLQSFYEASVVSGQGMTVFQSEQVDRFLSTPQFSPRSTEGGAAPGSLSCPLGHRRIPL